MSELLTSAEVAAALGVGVSSVKRWTDEGKLASVRTPGGHRRYRADAVKQFADVQGFSAAELRGDDREDESVEERQKLFLRAIERGEPRAARALLSAPSAAVLDQIVGETLRVIGEKWQREEWDVHQEHRASYLIAELIDALRPDQSGEGAIAMLATVPGEQHELPLRMLRVILETAGWRTVYIGANVPWQSTAAAIDEVLPSLVLFTSRDVEAFEKEPFRKIVEKAARHRANVVIGGAWARGRNTVHTGALRFRTLRAFERWLRRIS